MNPRERRGPRATANAAAYESAGSFESASRRKATSAAVDVMPPQVLPQTSTGRMRIR